jgi:hypothetical protein
MGMTSFRRTPANSVLLVLGLVLLAGCSDESTAPFPCRENPAGFGRIRGTVTSGGIAWPPSTTRA